jgi:hypothetical protein
MMNFVTYLMYFLQVRVTYDPTSIDFEIDDEWYDASLLFNHSLPKVNMMNVAIPSHSSILEANILEFAINDDPDFLEEFEDDDSMPGLLEKTPHLASWYYTQTMMTSEASSMPELLDRPEDSSLSDSDDESVPDLHAAQYGIWNRGGINLTKENTTEDDSDDRRDEEVKTRSKRASRAARRNKQRKSADKKGIPLFPTKNCRARPPYSQ